MSYQAYRQTLQRSEDPRATEYRLFTEVTRALMEAESLPKRHPKAIKALDWNRRMWSTFSSDCAIAGNGLPPELRASIISLSLWVSKHTSQVMRGNAQVAALININKTVMEGLKPKSLQTGSSASPAAYAREASTHKESTGTPLHAQLSI